MRPIGLALICLALLSGPAAAQDIARATVAGKCAAVPILRGATPIVEVRIGDKGPFRFAIDTAASGHGRISAALAAELGLPRVGGSADQPVFAVSEVSIGAVSFKNLDLVVPGAGDAGAAGVDGVLGNGLLALLPLTLDFGNARARFGGPELEEGVPLDFERGAPVLPLEITGTRFKVRFDTSRTSPALALDEAAAGSLPLAGEAVRWLGRDTMSEAPLAVSVTAGTVPLPVRAVAWPSPRAGGIIGWRGFDGMSVTLDATAQLARVETSGAPPRCAD
jgi:hypothetical protein